MQKATFEVMEEKSATPSTVAIEAIHYGTVKARIEKRLSDDGAEDQKTFDDLSRSTNVQAILEATNTAIVKFYEAESFGKGVAAGYAVRLGRILFILKRKVEETKELWHDYVAKNIKGMSQRTVDKHLKISQIRGVQNHLALGIERLYLIADAIKGSESADPISELFSKHNLEFNPTMDMPFDDFKKRIDAIALEKKFSTEGIQVSANTATKMAERGVKINAVDLEKLKAIMQSDGNTDKFLQTLWVNPKRPTSSSGKAGSKDSVKRIRSFNKLAAEFQDVIQAAKSTSDSDILKSIDLKTLDDLIADLEALRVHLESR